MSVFKEMGLREVINANGKMTILGVSTAGDRVADNVRDALKNFVIIEELIDYAGSVIAKKTGSQGGCPTSGAAAGIAICAAASITGTNKHLVERMPDSEGLANEIIIQKGQAVNFGGSVTQMMRLGGAIPVEVGCANKVEKYNIEGAITSKTAALFCVVSHHAVQKGMQSPAAVIEIAARHGLPVIIDAAAEEDFTKYAALGADMVIYSGAKALCGPTSGLICGKQRYTEACKLQYKGIGRAMKVSKESMTGLITALEDYDGNDDSARQRSMAEAICNDLSGVGGVSCRVVSDEAGRAIYRSEIKIDAAQAGITAAELNETLKGRDPAIYLRDYYVNSGLLSVDTRALTEEQGKTIAEAVKNIIRGARHA